MALPPFKYTPPMETPPVGGLLTVANILTDTSPYRIINGVQPIVRNTFSRRVSADKVTVCFDRTEPLSPNPGLFPEGQVYDAYLLETQTACDPTITDDELTAAATHTLDMQREPIVAGLVFSEVIPDAIAEAIAPYPVETIDMPVEMILAMADQHTMYGMGTRVVHLNAYWATYLLGKGVIVKSGSIYRTAMGNPIAFSGAYMGDNTFADAFVTGPVTLYQTPVEVRNVLTPKENDRVAIASQIIVPILIGDPQTFVKVNITTDPYPAGGGVTPGAYALLPGFTPGTDAVPGTSE